MGSRVDTPRLPLFFVWLLTPDIILTVLYEGLVAESATGQLVPGFAESDITSRAAYMTRAESILLGDYPVAPPYFFVSKHLVRPGIAGLENNVLDRHPSKYLFLEQKP